MPIREKTADRRAKRESRPRKTQKILCGGSGPGRIVDCSGMCLSGCPDRRDLAVASDSQRTRESTH